MSRGPNAAKCLSNVFALSICSKYWGWSTRLSVLPNRSRGQWPLKVSIMISVVIGSIPGTSHYNQKMYWDKFQYKKRSMLVPILFHLCTLICYADKTGTREKLTYWKVTEGDHLNYFFFIFPLKNLTLDIWQWTARKIFPSLLIFNLCGLSECE